MYLNCSHYASIYQGEGVVVGPFGLLGKLLAAASPERATQKIEEVDECEEDESVKEAKEGSEEAREGCEQGDHRARLLKMRLSNTVLGATPR